MMVCFIRLSKVLSSSHFAFVEIPGIKKNNVGGED